MDQKESEEKKLRVNNKRCKNCGSSLTYVRIKNKEVVCRNCGYITSLREYE